jgi:glycosyltransferase 2 family protein
MKFGWRGALGVLLSVALLWWTLHDIPVATVWQALKSSNALLFILSAAAATVIFPLRAIRWQVILDPVAGRVPLGQLWRATAIGMMVNNVAPLRAGEFARAYALTREPSGVRFPASLASLAVDRVFDAVVLMLLLVASTMAPAFPSATLIQGQPVSRYTLVFAVGVGAMFVVLYALVFFPSILIGWFETVAERLSPRFRERGRHLLLSFTSGLSVLRSPGRFIAVLWWTVLHWLVNGLAFWLGFKAVGIDAPFSAALFLQGLIAIGVAAPSAPGFFGVFEFFAVLGLGVYGVSREQAVTWALGYHILSFLPITFIGAYYFARLGLHFKEIDSSKEPPDGSGGTRGPDGLRAAQATRPAAS